MKYIIMLFSVTAIFLSAVTIEGVGISKNKNDSLKSSLSDLTNKISVNVKSDFKSYTNVLDGDYKKNREQLISISSNLPIIGAVFRVSPDNNGVKTIASLSSNLSLSSYVQELNRLKKSIEKSQKRIKIEKNKTVIYNSLIQMLLEVNQFNKHKIVALVLGGIKLPNISISISEIKSDIFKLEEKVPSLEIAAKILSKNITKKDIYISPVKLSGSSEITQLAKILKDTISKYVGSVEYPDDAKYFLRGSYDILNETIFVTMYLSNKENKILKTTTVLLQKNAYKDIQYKVKTKSFDQSLNSEFVKNGELYVNIGFNRFDRSNGIDLVDGDLVDIVVKSSKPVCYFLLGHTLKNDNKFSYLLPIGSGDSKFINNITGKDVNRFITVADNVPTDKPFGNEVLQIFASTFTKDNKCPLVVPHCKENKNDYCVVSKKPTYAIKKTRALNINKKDNRVEHSEASISFTSFPKIRGSLK
jgi:hypothetical protein